MLLEEEGEGKREVILRSGAPVGMKRNWVGRAQEREFIRWLMKFWVSIDFFLIL